MKCQYCDLGQPIISREKNGFIDGRTIKIGFHITNVYGKKVFHTIVRLPIEYCPVCGKKLISKEEK
jgi:ssDNA-binding Zn-finger/Zn-ribbon topoisomerase 1